MLHGDWFKRNNCWYFPDDLRIFVLKSNLLAPFTQINAQNAFICIKDVPWRFVNMLHFAILEIFLGYDIVSFRGGHVKATLILKDKAFDWLTAVIIAILYRSVCQEHTLYPAYTQNLYQYVPIRLCWFRLFTHIMSFVPPSQSSLCCNLRSKGS